MDFDSTAFIIIVDFKQAGQMSEANTLSSMICNIQSKISRLLQEQMEQKLAQQHLSSSIRTLQQKSERSNILRNKMQEQHHENMKYFDEKISNHQQTLSKFKELYQNFQQNRANPSLNLVPFQKQANPQSILPSQFSESIKTARSIRIPDPDRAKPSDNQSMSVICQIQCQGCGQSFKPYSYYQHLPRCNRVPMCTSMLLH